MTIGLALIFSTVSQTFSLPPRLLEAVCTVESSLNPKAFHKDDGGHNSVGLCQVQLRTARLLGYKGKESGLYDPYTNAYYAAAYLRHQLDRYGGDVNKAINSYNCGHYVPTYVKYLVRVRRVYGRN